MTPADLFQLQSESQSCRGRVLLAFDDPSGHEKYPGWPLRNLMLLASARWGMQEMGVICVRCLRGPVSAQRCLYVHVELPPLPPGMALLLSCAPVALTHSLTALTDDVSELSCFDIISTAAVLRTCQHLTNGDIHRQHTLMDLRFLGGLMTITVCPILDMLCLRLLT